MTVEGTEVFGCRVGARLWTIDWIDVHEATPRTGGRNFLEVHSAQTTAQTEAGMLSARISSMIHDTFRVLAPVDLGFLPDGRFYIMRHGVPGTLLPELGELALPRAIGIARSLAETLAIVHARGVTAGQLGHHAIFVETTTTGEDRARLYDFRNAGHATDLWPVAADIRRCAIVLFELASGTRVTNPAVVDFGRAPKDVGRLVQSALDDRIPTATALADEIGELRLMASDLPVARVVKRDR